MVKQVLVLLFLLCSGGFGYTQSTKKDGSKNFKEQNNPGKRANNFSYINPRGTKQQLNNLQADYIILFFYNPECEACKQYKDALTQSKIINQQIQSKKLKVLAVYIGKDIALWKRHLPEMPKNWLHGRDQNDYLFKNNIYDLHAIPTIYLLDKHKKVVLKDVLDVGQIEKMLK